MTAPTKTELGKIFSNILQTVIAAGIIWLASEVNSIEVKMAHIEERTNNLEDVRPAMNQMQSVQEDIKMRLIRVEDNQHKSFKLN